MELTQRKKPPKHSGKPLLDHGIAVLLGVVSPFSPPSQSALEWLCTSLLSTTLRQDFRKKLDVENIKKITAPTTRSRPAAGGSCVHSSYKLRSHATCGSSPVTPVLPPVTLVRGRGYGRG